MSNFIKVFAKRPDSKWYSTNVSNNLKALQRFVGGYIETVTLAEDVVVICDEEGRLKGKEHCATVMGAEFVGNILLAGVKGDDFCDIPISFRDAKKIGLIKDEVNGI